MAVPLHALADDLAGGDVEGGEQRRGAVALVVVRHGAGAALLQRQPGLRAVERLDLALLVDAQHQRLVRRVEVEADDVLTFSTNCWSFDSLKVFTRCGLSPCAFQMRCTLVWLSPTAGPSCARSNASPAGGFSCKRHVNHPLDHRSRQRRLAPGPAGVAPQPFDALRQDSAPASGRPCACSCPTARTIAIIPAAGRRHQHDARPPNQLLRRVAVRHPTFQRRPIPRRQPDATLLLHPRRIASSGSLWESFVSDGTRVLVEKRLDGTLTTRQLLPVRFVPLTRAE